MVLDKGSIEETGKNPSYFIGENYNWSLFLTDFFFNHLTADSEVTSEQHLSSNVLSRNQRDHRNVMGPQTFDWIYFVISKTKTGPMPAISSPGD